MTILKFEHSKIFRMLKLIGRSRSLRKITWSAALEKQKAHQEWFLLSVFTPWPRGLLYKAFVEASAEPLALKIKTKYVLCSEGVLNRFDYERLIIEDIRKRYLKLNEIDSKIIPLSSGQIRKEVWKFQLHHGFRPGVPGISKYRGYHIGL